MPRLFWTSVFLLLCLSINERECAKVYQTTPEDAADVMNRTERYLRPVDFRCHMYALPDIFNFEESYITSKYALEDFPPYDKKNRCTNKAEHYYPILKGLDPMMPYYVDTLHRGIAVANDSDALLSAETPLQRTKYYCASMRLKMVEFVIICNVFRQMREMFAEKLTERLCLDEDGCYNVMGYYEEDLPYCVKYTAINQFKNSPVGSWHHAIINYCKLTEMVPGVEAAKYDMAIFRGKGRTRENLMAMCLYLRYRLLPEEGKEQEIPEDVADYDTFDTETTIETEHQNAASIVFAIGWWNVLSLLTMYCL